jgi:hypothetical protein
MTYDMPCETIRFAWRNERFVLAVFGFVQAQNEAAGSTSSSDRRVRLAGRCSEKVAIPNSLFESAVTH